MAEPILEVDDLTIRFKLKHGELRAVDGVSFKINKGETFGLVGESGSGKTVTARSIMRLVPMPPGELVKGSVRYEGRDIYALSDDEIRELRGTHISMVFQEPISALNPVYSVGAQITDALRTNMGLDARAARERCIELMQLVGIPSPEQRIDSYVHEFSGGMRQRVMLAMALSCDPNFLIADEPTTALDVTIQATILELIESMIERFDIADLHHPQSRRGRACLRLDRRDVRVAPGRVRRQARDFQESAASLYRGSAEFHTAARHAVEVPDADQGLGLQYDGPADGM